MSAINTFAFQNVIVFSHTRGACACVFAEETLQPMQEPIVTARWAVETNPDGTRRLVRHWLKNETKVQAEGSGRSSR